MLLFPEEEHDAIRAGRTTVTFRDWDKLRVEAGKEYKSFRLGFVRVEEIGYIDFKKIPQEDMEAAGFDSPEEFKRVFRKRNPGFNFGSGKLIRIRFTYLGSENRAASRIEPNDQEVIRIMERLVEIDVLSELEVKCDEILDFLSDGTAKNSTRIASHFELSRQDVRKIMAAIKNEGLVELTREGYVLTVRGKTYLGSKV